MFELGIEKFRNRKEKRTGPGGKDVGRRGERGKPGPCWAGLGSWAGLVFYLSGFFSFLFLIQTRFEFKYKFEFNHTQIIETMHQHECNTKIKPMINFNYLRNKN